MSDGASDQASLDKADPARAAALDAALDASTARAKAANDALEAAIRGNPGLMRLARALLAGADIAAPLIAGALGGPGAVVIAETALRVAHAARDAADGA